MSKKGKTQDVRRFYVQSALSGFGSPDKQTNEDSSSKAQVIPPAQSPFFWQQKRYIVYVPVIVTETSVSSSQYEYKVSVPTNIDFSLSPYKPKSKNLSGQAYSVAKETNVDNSGLYLVYGVPTSGSDTLSPIAVNPIRDAVPYIFSRVLGQVSRAIEHILYFSGKGEKLQASPDDSRQRSSVTPTPKDLGTDKVTRRGSKVRKQVRVEGQTKDPPSVDETNGKILGERPENGADKLGGISDDPFEGSALAGHTMDF